MNPSDFYILVVDDEESICSILYETLTGEGYNVTTVSSGEEALKYLQQNDLPHIVMTDIRMPGISGVELSMSIKEISSEIEVIIMTSHASLDTATQAIRVGVYDYINKPFNDLNEIKTLILRVIDKIYLRLENKHLMEELKRKNEEIMSANKEILAISDEITAIYRFSKEISELLDPNDVMDKFLQYMSALNYGGICFFLKYFPSKTALVITQLKSMAIESKYTQEELQGFINVGIKIGSDNDKGIISILNNMQDHQAIKNLVMKLFNTVSYKSFPLIIRGTPIGVIIIIGPEELRGREQKISLQYFNQLEHSYDKALLHNKIKDLAIKDGLTGLYNHRYFQDRLELEAKRARRLEHPLSIIFFDIDHFKKYNDINGHPMGDMLLRSLADLLKICCRSTDIICRYGGEEFCIILPHTDAKGALTKAENIRKLVEDTEFPNQEKQPNGNLTISIGVSEMPAHADTPEMLIKLADEALYKVKEQGRNNTIAAECPNDYVVPYKAKEIITGPRDV
ncbi:MAG: diguanylate cyclase [Oligoflexia bacterium]|nr:diguanylate cyclase [Oligoflexia bacterium]